MKELRREEEEEQGVNFQASVAVFLADNPLPASLNRQDGDSIADLGCLSRIRIFSIPDPGSDFFLTPGSRIKKFKFF